MENKSRLPKPSGLRPPQVMKPIFDHAQGTTKSKAPIISRLEPRPQFLRRRSKSVSDLRSFAERPISKVSDLKKITENIRPKVIIE